MKVMNFSPCSLVNSKGGFGWILIQDIHDSHCDNDTIGDLNDLATMLTIANMMTMITTVDQISKLIIIRLFHVFQHKKQCTMHCTDW